MLESNGITVDRFSGNAVTTVFTLSISPVAASNTSVYIEGVYQQKDTYTVSGADVTFSTAPPVGVDTIEVITSAPFTFSIGTPSDGSVTTVKLVDLNVTSAKLADLGVTTVKLAASAVTNAKLANAPANSIKGNNTGISDVSLDLTVTEATAMLNNFTPTLKGLTPLSGGGTVNFLRADGTWSPAGTGSVTSVSMTVPTFLSIAGSPVTTTGTLAVTLSGTALPVLNGGTGVTTSTGSGSNVLSTSPTLVTPILGTPTSGVATNLTGTAAGLTAGTATNLAGGLGGSVPYQSAAGVTVMLANGTAGQLLKSNGTTVAPSWVTAAAGTTITTWTAYTPTITGLGTATGVSFFWKQIGDSIFVKGSLTCGTNTAVLVTFTLPGVITIDAAKVSINNTTSNPGAAIGLYWSQTAFQDGPIVTATGTSTSLIYAGTNGAGPACQTPNVGNTTFTNNQEISLTFEAPITGWA